MSARSATATSNTNNTEPADSTSPPPHSATGTPSTPIAPSPRSTPQTIRSTRSCSASCHRSAGNTSTSPATTRGKPPGNRTAAGFDGYGRFHGLNVRDDPFSEGTRACPTYQIATKIPIGQHNAASIESRMTISISKPSVCEQSRTTPTIINYQCGEHPSPIDDRNHRFALLAEGTLVGFESAWSQLTWIEFFKRQVPRRAPQRLAVRQPARSTRAYRD